MWSFVCDALAHTIDVGPDVAAVCPWSDWDPGTVQFCERRLCATIVEPSNAWSSLAYVILGVIMMVKARSPVAIAIAAAQLMIGVGSFFFHGTGTFAGEVVDQIGMFMLSSLILAASLAQHLGWSGRRTVVVYAAGVAVSTAILLVFRPVGIPLFAVQLAAGLALQLWLWRKAGAKDAPVFRVFLSGLGIFLVSFSIWITDITGLVCDPDNHLVTGHAVWHVLNAICIWRLSIFYRARIG
jgi:hypothetical protein